MAITAEFWSDFSNFNAGVDTADRKLKGLQGRSKETADSFTQLTTTMDTMTGVLGALGIDATISGVINFTKEIFASADALVRLSDQTGISIDNLQRLGDAAEVSGNTMDEVTGAITKLQENIGSGNKAALAALEQLKVPLEDIRSMAPEEQFFAIGEAIAGVEDPMMRVTLAGDLMGKMGVRVLPMMKQGFQDVRDGAVVMSTATVQALNDVDNAYKQAASTFKGQVAEFIKFAFLGWGEAARNAKAYAVQVESAVGPTIAMAAPLEKLTLDTTQQANIERVLGENLKETQEQAKAAKKEEEALADFREAASKRQFEILTLLKKEELDRAAVVNAQVKAELDARAQLNAAYGLDVQGHAKMTSALDIYQQKLAALHTLKQAGIDQSAQEQVLMNEYTDALYAEATAQDAATAAAERAPAKVREVGNSMQEAAGKTGVFMQQLQMLVDDPKLAAFFGGNPVAATLYSGGFGETSVTPEEAAAMAAGQFINFAGFGSAQNQMSRISQNRAATVVNVTQPLGTPDAIARAVGDALGTRARGTGQRL